VTHDLSGRRALPTGFAVRLGADTRLRDSGRSLTGGSSGRVVYLTAAAACLVDRSGTVVVRDTLSSALAGALLDRGLADPWWPGPPGHDHVDDVTVVVPVRDRADPLARLLGALPPGLPVVVVDDGSEDAAAVADVADRFGALPVRHDASRGPAGARNTGLARATTGLVAFVDSDVVPVPGWLATLARHFADPGVGAVGPRVRGLEPEGDDSWLCRYEAARSSLDLGPAPAAVHPHGKVAYLPSAALMVRREAVPHGFDAALRVAEDVDLVWRVHEAGWRVRYEPRSVVRHEHRTRTGPWLRRKAFYGTGAALLAERHGAAVAPMVLTPWTALLAALTLAQRRWSVPAAGVVGALATLRISRSLHGSRRPVRTGAALALTGAAATLRQVASALTRHYWPLAVPAALASRRARRALLVAAVADGLLDHRRTRPDLDPFRYLLARRLDDAGYGAGLWLGAVRARSARALMPAAPGFRRRAERAHTRVRGPHPQRRSRR
jgi:mycofactocin glycosyltransferase